MNVTHFRSRVRATIASIVIAAGASLTADAMASGPKLPAATNPQWQSECASCHVAYPPRMLPAGAWRAIMAGLDRHFGADASLDAATAASIRTFLESNAGGDVPRPSDAPVLRITETARFIRKHHEVPPIVWASAKVGSAANCGACHAGAARGAFSDHDVRIPR